MNSSLKRITVERKEKEESETATVERTMAWDSMDEVIHFSFLR